jgi:L-lactate dehydrogenase complex protein LldG
VLFTEDELVVNTLAYLAQHFVVLLDPDDIVSGLQAYVRSEFPRAAHAGFHTGPSATGDIEGALIHGAQGARTLTVAFIPRRHPGRRAATS